MWKNGSGPIKRGSNSVVASPAGDCPIQDLNDKEGTRIADITEQYADDHDVWASDFLDAWQRMQAIKCPDLKDGPENSWLGYYSLKEMGADIGENYLGFLYVVIYSQYDFLIIFKFFNIFISFC